MMKSYDHQTRIGIVGHPSSGKDTVAAYLIENHNFVHVSTGDLIRFYIAEHNLGDADRALLNQVSTFLRTEHGADYFARLALQTQAEHLCVSGMRTAAEVAALQEAGATIIACTAPLKTRYHRARDRGRIGDSISFELFCEQEEAEAANVNPAAQNVAAVIAMADYTLENEGSLHALETEVEGLLKQIRRKKT